MCALMEVNSIALLSVVMMASGVLISMAGLLVSIWVTPARSHLAERGRHGSPTEATADGGRVPDPCRAPARSRSSAGPLVLLLGLILAAAGTVMRLSVLGR